MEVRGHIIVWTKTRLNRKKWTAQFLGIYGRRKTGMDRNSYDKTSIQLNISNKTELISHS